MSNIQASITIGWIIIALLLILFLFNIVAAIAIEWPNIKEVFYRLKEIVTSSKS